MDSFLNQGGQFHRLQHVGAVIAGGAVGAQGNVDARAQAFGNRRDTGTEVKIRRRVMTDGYTVLREAPDVFLRQIYAVDGEHFVGQETDSLQQIDDILAVIAEAHFIIHFRLLQMHGIADILAEAILQHGLIAFFCC